MIEIRPAESIYRAHGRIQNGTFDGRWHFSFDQYHDPKFEHFGTLRVLNDDTLSPGAVWPLHPHRENEVVTYCAGGEFRHEDEHGKGGILRKGWVQHTTIGRGMYHSEINNRPDEPMRFIQMWFFPSQHGLTPRVEQKEVEKTDRTNRLLPIVSNDHAGALPIVSDAEVYSCYLEAGIEVTHPAKPGWGIYLYNVEGGTVGVNTKPLPALAAAEITKEKLIRIAAQGDAELLLIHVLLR
ncbi:MAG TPA: pirin family protein [Thermodesulfobacteriota bacterium]|nr:pirin family protein [Thermodesulfobacteriota bacterium]